MNWSENTIDSSVGFLIRTDEAAAEKGRETVERELRELSDKLAHLVNARVSEGQHLALLTLAYGIGLDELKRSGVLRDFNRGRIDLVADSFERWTKVSGVEDEHLKKVRALQRRIFERT